MIKFVLKIPIKKDNTISYLRSINVMSQAFHEEINYDPELNLTTQDLATLSLDKEIPIKF